MRDREREKEMRRNSQKIYGLSGDETVKCREEREREYNKKQKLPVSVKLYDMLLLCSYFFVLLFIYYFLEIKWMNSFFFFFFF